MNAVKIPIIHSVLDAGAVGETIAAYFDLPGPVHCELLTRGMNDVYLVRSGGDRFASRVWRHAFRDEAMVAYELAFLSHLRRAGLPVVSARRTTEGAFHLPVQAPEGERYLALFDWAEGEPYGAHADADGARRIGGIIGQIHLAGADFKPAAPRTVGRSRAFARELPHLLRMVAHRPEDMDYYPRAIAAVEEALAPVDEARAAFGPSHGDFHLYNAFVAPGGSTVILDFDNCGEDHYVQELMSFAWANHYVGVGEDITEAFLDGYGAVRPLSNAEADLIPTFFAAKELRFLCGFAANVNAVGHSTLLNPDLDWFAENVRKHVTNAALM
jgi:Ser/Thr protein kinase RdoA (MazF antagonist)